jgi:hypothetical protein
VFEAFSDLLPFSKPVRLTFLGHLSDAENLAFTTNPSSHEFFVLETVLDGSDADLRFSFLELNPFVWLQALGFLLDPTASIFIVAR